MTIPGKHVQKPPTGGLMSGPNIDAQVIVMNALTDKCLLDGNPVGEAPQMA